MIAAINPADNPLSLEFYRLLWHNFAPAILPFVVACGVTVGLVPVMRRLSFRVGAVSLPGGRNINVRPTARLGGLALAGGFIVAGAVFGLGRGFSNREVLTMLGAGAVTVGVLAVDDVRQLRARWTLSLQLVVAVGVAAAGAITINFINFGGGHILHLGVLAFPVTLLWILGMENTMNFLDGVDGLAAGVSAIVALALLLAAVNRETEDPSQLAVVVLCAALIGACAGFLFFNFHPARIFMGGGAHFLGLTLAILSIFGIAKGAVVFALMVPVMALVIPIADTGWSIVRRRRQQISIAHPDTAHIHHQLLDFGLSQRETCLVIYFATGITSGIGLMLYGHRKILGVVVVLLLVALSTLLGQRLYELENGPAERADAKGPLLES